MNRLFCLKRAFRGSLSKLVSLLIFRINLKVIQTWWTRKELLKGLSKLFSHVLSTHSLMCKLLTQIFLMQHFEILRPFFSIQDVNILSKINSQVMLNSLFNTLIWNFKSDWKFLIWFFFLWLLISYQTSKLRPKINVWKKNQISDRKIKSCWNDLIWNLLLDLTWFIFAVFDVKSFWLLIFMWQRKRA